jgi:uncharacterized membrane protein
MGQGAAGSPARGCPPAGPSAEDSEGPAKTMDHHEQHHQHHQKEREERIKHEKESERRAEKLPARIHPAWFLVVGAVLTLLAVLVWIFMSA